MPILPFTGAPTPKKFLRVADPGGLFGVKTFNATALSPAGSNFTFQQQFSVPYLNEPVMVRVIYDNDLTSVSTISGVAIATGCSTATNPVLSSGGAAPWTVVSGGVTVPAASGVTGTTTYSATPWQFLQVDARTDGAPFGTIYVRSFNLSGTFRGYQGNSGYDFTGYHGLGLRNDQFSSYQSGNFCTTNQTSFNPGANVNTQYAPAYIQILSLKRAITICGVGDSTTLGLRTPGQSFNFMAQAAEALSTVAKPVGWYNYGFSGQTSAVFMAGGTSLLQDANRTPSIMIIQPASQNDASPYTQASVNTSFGLALQLALKCQQMGVLAIFRTMQPTAAITTVAMEGVRNSLNAVVRASGFPYLDMDAAVSNNSGSIAALKAAFDSGDGIHPSQAGHAATAALLMKQTFPALNFHV